ncbi:5'-methylthioadenosine nucleosidase [Bifidobacterium lemurum]|uniref:5'-methylthioadenosine nucleosidase n=1 Tax=Bifidobacterium lemurum TaxID=1603886 RepID=A0A261FRY3_9BIFI|nr:5'-methylthioadenosine/S-adenosylhomocysteine nucleosidase [Bifidobacterium lemurum]OZG61917.1 5'-methylthioadenosine nucleosidase [Bifidobacterium lemurum]QOL33291.1 5'-methylthioadenosine/S-adenosylhomocysteine nucleosidase [Bifidobacterium lemurum]
MTVRVAVVTALEKEAELFFEALGTNGETRYGMHTAAGRYHDVELAVAVAGMGIVNTAAAAQYLIMEHRPDALVFSGIAGGLNPRMDIDDIVIGERVIYLGADTALIAESEPYLEEFASSAPLVERAARVLDARGLRRVESVAEHGDTTMFVEPKPSHTQPTYVVGTVASSITFNTAPADLDRSVAFHHADCEEMEGVAAAQIAAKAGVDCLVIRSLSNMCGESYEQLDGRDTDLRRSARLVAGVVLEMLEGM